MEGRWFGLRISICFSTDRGNMQFKKVHIEDKPLFDEFLNSSSYINDHYYASEFNFSYLYCWNVSDNISYAITPKAIFIKALVGGKLGFLPPLVKSDADFMPAVKYLEEYCAAERLPFVVKSMTREMVEVLEREKHGYKIVYNRDNSEYLYDRDDLISLVGKKFAAKRNHINYFKCNYAYEFSDYDERDRQEIINLMFDWKNQTGNMEFTEDTAIDNAIAFYRQLGLKCSCLRVDGKLIAFTIGFVAHNNIAIVLFEKADANIRGAYPMINNLFAVKEFQDVKWINRQEDMGIEGLRKAKMSYHPIAMCEKYDIL